MSLSPGAKLGPYEIVSPLGAGGMGEVYRARDTRLDRIVAIKVIAEQLQSNPELKARFEREARAISSLQHPHICTLFDIGYQDGSCFLVMEYLDGETLASRLLKGALPLDQVLKIGSALADALAKAHSHGVIHRDVKPGNIMLTKSGAKLMDFGLARGAGSAMPLHAADAQLTPSTPTVNLSTLASSASPLTQKGTIVGTFQYMAPEILHGREADARSDIFSAGCVLYEMATGIRPFAGKTQMGVLTAILEKEPDPISTLQPSVPLALNSAIRTALSKDPEDRWQTAADLRHALALVGESSTQERPASATDKSKSKQKLFALLAAVFSLVAIASFITAGLHRPPALPLLSSELDLPPGMILDTLNDPVAISPDGRQLALALLNAEGVSQLWTRRLDTGQMIAVAGTAGAEYPFWSPDSGSIGFFAGSKLKRVDQSSGLVQNICDATQGRGGTWNESGIIVFAPNLYGGLWQVPASGGTPSDLAIPVTPDESLRVPHFLPDGNHFLFLRFPQNGPSHIQAFSLANRQVTDLIEADAAGQYGASRYLIFVRNGNLFAQDFDPRALHLSGQPVVIATGVQLDPARKTATFSVSQSGMLVYAPGAEVSLNQLQWIDSTGRVLGKIGDPAGYYLQLSLSPDDRLVAVANQKYQVNILDVATGTYRPFTYSGKNPLDQQFIWSPDGKWLAFTADVADNHWAIEIKATDGRTEARTVHNCQLEACAATSWSPDGKILAIEESTAAGIDGSVTLLAVDSRQEIYRVTRASAGTISPDGKWLALISEDSGKPQIYVTSMKPDSQKWQLTSEGVTGFSWPVAGTLFYGTTKGTIVGVNVSSKGDEFQIGQSEVKFGGRVFASKYFWDVTHDGKRAIIAVPTETAERHSLKLLQNWTTALKQ